jgi:hypothetical protein
MTYRYALKTSSEKACIADSCVARNSRVQSDTRYKTDLVIGYLILITKHFSAEWVVLYIIFLSTEWNIHMFVVGSSSDNAKSNFQSSDPKPKSAPIIAQIVVISTFQSITKFRRQVQVIQTTRLRSVATRLQLVTPTIWTAHTGAPYRPNWHRCYIPLHSGVQCVLLWLEAGFSTGASILPLSNAQFSSHPLDFASQNTAIRSHLPPHLCSPNPIIRQ